ncbi:unnamed protein product, partial [Effrenium voratum]
CQGGTCKVLPYVTMDVCRSSVEHTLLPSLRFCPWSIFRFAMLKPPMRQQDQLMASKAKEKLWQEALGIFQEVKASARPDIVMYTTALTACRKAAKWQAALAILQEAQEEAEVNVTTFTAALSCCGKAAQWKQALHVLGCMQKWQLQPNVVTMGAAIDACGKSQQWQRVAALFAELSKRSFQPNAVVLSAGISAVEKAGCWQLALRLLRTADARGANVWAYNAAISACGQSARWQDALLLMREAAEAAVRVDTITASAASGACEKASAWHAALQLLHVLPHASVDANVVTYSSAVSACEKQSRWRFASCLLALAQGARLGDVILHGASVSSCQKSNEWRWAVQGLARLPQLSLVPDLVVQNAGISACDDWRRSLALMPRTSARSRRNLVTYSSALTGKVHWRHSLQLLAELRSRGLEAAPIVYTSIMNSLLNRWQHAVYLTTATELDTVAYNAATNVCRLAAQWLQALFLARRLQDQRLQPSLLVFGWAFSASATTDWKSASPLADEMESLLRASLDKVRFARGRMRGPGLAHITRLIGHGGWRSALQLLQEKEAQERHLRANVITFSAAIKACDWNWALLLLAALHRRGLEANAITGTAVIRGGSWPVACHWLRRMCAERLADVVSYGACIGSARSAWQVAGLLLAELGGSNFICLGAAISACERSAAWKPALEMFRSGGRPDVVTYNVTVSACEKASQWHHALLLLEELEKRGDLDATMVSYNAATSAVAQVGAWPEALRLLNTADSNQLQADVITGSSAMSACERASRWAALQLPWAPRARKDVAVCNALISACEKAAQWPVAVHLLGALQPDAITFSSAISACEKRNEWEMALALFHLAIERLIAPNIVTYSAAISACAKTTIWQRALWLFGAAQRQQLQLNLVAYNAAMAGVEESQQWELASNLFEDARASVTVDVLTQSSLVGTLAKAMRWQRACLQLAHSAHLELVPDVVAYASTAGACEKVVPEVSAVVLMKFQRFGGVQMPAASQIRTKPWRKALRRLWALEAETRRSEILRSAAMSAVGAAGRWVVAQDLLQSFERVMLELDLVALNVALSSQKKRWHSALCCVRNAQGRALQPDQFTWGALSCRWAVAELLLGVRPSLVSFNTMLSSLESWREALCRDTISFNATLRACPWQMSMALLDDMEAHWPLHIDLHVDLSPVAGHSFCGNVSVSAPDLISFSSSHGAGWREALERLDASRAKGLQPNEVIFGVAQAACAWPWPLLLLREMEAQLLKRDAAACASCITASPKAQWQEALQVFAGLGKRQTGIIPCNAAISACQRASRVEQAIQLLAEARANQAANVVTYGAAISACESSSDWPLALHLLGDLSHAQLQPNILTFAAAASACEKAAKRLVQATLECGACSKAKAWQSALWLLHAVPRADALTYRFVAEVLPCTPRLELLAALQRLGLRLLPLGVKPWVRRVGPTWRHGLDIQSLTPRVFNPSRAMRGPLQELAKARRWSLDCPPEGSCGAKIRVAGRMGVTLATGDTHGAREADLSQADLGLLKACADDPDERQWQKALHLFRELEDEGLEGTAVTFGSLVSSCEKASQWQRALDLAAQATSRGLGSIVTCNAALSACGKGRNWQMAMEVFRKVEADGLQGTVVTFGSLVSTCEKSCQWQRALNLMADAAARGLVNIITCNAALSACAKGRNWQKAMEVLDLVQQLRLEPDILTYSAGISACEGFGLWMEALALLGQALANKIQADLIAYNSLLSACEKAGRWQRGFALFDAMESSAVPPDVISRNAGISSCDQWQRSFCLLTGGDVVSYSAAAFACAKPTEDVTWHQALALLEAAAAAAAAPLGASVVATSAGINACEAAQRWRHALALLQGLHSRRLQPDAIAYSSAASACETAAEWQQALQILRDLKRRLQPDLYCFNAGISACVKSEQWEQALQLLQEAVETVQVDVITFSSAMSGRWVDWQRAIWLLAEISRREIQANIIAYCSAITSCARGAQWQQALLVLFQSQVSSESIAWDAALTACEKGSWQCTLELLELLKSKRLQMDSISYQAATNSYVRAQKWYPAVPLLEKAGSYAEECCLDALGTVAQKIQRDIQDSSWFAGPGSMR